MTRPPLSDRDTMRDLLVRNLYGPVPGPPDDLTVERFPVPGAERLRITMSVGPRRFAVDAALWLPDGDGPWPLVCGLDFVGPAGVLMGDDFPLDPDARIHSRPELGAPEGRLGETLRGTSAYRWPVELLTRAGFAVMVSCYGSWVPDDAAEWAAHGVAPLVDMPEARAISLWAWAMMRMVDVGAALAEVDPTRGAVAGQSRLGKAALWAGANDPRIGAVFANNSGCGGAALARHPVGETLVQMAERFPHWTVPNPGYATPDALPFDQHFLLSTIAPRPLFLASAQEDDWADSRGTEMALDAARVGKPDWSATHQIRPGGHDLLPLDWKRFLAFLSDSGF